MIQIPDFSAAWSKIRMFLEGMDQASAADPLEGHRRRIIQLEERLTRLEAALAGTADCIDQITARS